MEQVQELIHPEWKQVLYPMMRDLQSLTDSILPESTVDTKTLLRPLRQTPFNDVKVVILKDVPYALPGISNGMGYGVQDVGPSSLWTSDLFEIQECLRHDLRQKIGDPSLISWANQGVLMLPVIWTCPPYKPWDHVYRGWQMITGYIIDQLNMIDREIVFMTWDSLSREMVNSFIPTDHHLHLTGIGPQHEDFRKQKYFSRCNELLEQYGQTPIKWGVDL